MTKLTSLAEAVAKNVQSGDSVYIAGFTHLIGFAAAHEIIRQRLRRLTLIRMTPDIVYDQMVGAGCASDLIISYLGNPGAGRLHAIDRALQTGNLSIVEFTHGSMLSALKAGATGAPFLPVPALAVSDIRTTNRYIRQIESPFDGTTVVVTSPIAPDVAFVHVQRCDEHGNAQVWGATGELAAAAFAARRVVITAEEIVPEQVIRNDPNRTLIPGLAVDAVVHVPWGAHPSFAQGYYARDNQFYRDWASISSNLERFDEYLERWIFGCESRADYCRMMSTSATKLAGIGDGWSGQVNYGSAASLAQAGA